DDGLDILLENMLEEPSSLIYRTSCKRDWPKGCGPRAKLKVKKRWAKRRCKTKAQKASQCCGPCTGKKRACRLEFRRRGRLETEDGWIWHAGDCIGLYGWDPWPSGEPMESGDKGIDEDRLSGVWRASCHDARKRLKGRGIERRSGAEMLDASDARSCAGGRQAAGVGDTRGTVGVRESTVGDRDMGVDGMRKRAGEREKDVGASSVGRNRASGEDAREQASGEGARTRAHDWGAHAQGLNLAGLGVPSDGAHAHEAGSGSWASALARDWETGARGLVRTGLGETMAT
ncbi:Unknown protein, partial [Striga hermonthica]